MKCPYCKKRYADWSKHLERNFPCLYKHREILKIEAKMDAVARLEKANRKGR